MQMWLLKAAPVLALQQADGLGFAYVTVVDENASFAGIMPGDRLDINGPGSISKSTLVGVKFPWEDPNAPFNGPYTINGGTLAFSVTVPASPFAGPGPFTPEGMLICASITASGARSPFGGYVCAYSDPSAPPPQPPAGSPATISAAVLASYTGGPQVANVWDPAQQESVVYTQEVQGWTGQVTVWPPECLNQASAGNIAKLIGGTLVRVVPPSPFAMAAQGAPPEVWGVSLNGKVAVAGEIAQKFPLFNPGSAVADIETAIMSCFH